MTREGEILAGLREEGVDTLEAETFLLLMARCPLVGIALYRPEFNLLARAWLAWIASDDHPDPLSEKAAEALYRRFGLVDGEVPSWTALGKRLGVSRYAVRRNAARGLAQAQVLTHAREGTVAEIMPDALKRVNLGTDKPSILYMSPERLAKVEERRRAPASTLSWRHRRPDPLWRPEHARTARPLTGYPPWRQEDV